VVKFHDVDIIDKMVEFFDAHGRLPSVKDLNGDQNLPSSSTVTHHFGSLEKAKRAALSFLVQQGKLPGEQNLFS
jgi:hypothetical protein